MLTVLMECRDQEPELAQTLAVLVTGAVEGLVSDVVILDHGSRDGTEKVADAAGCRFHRDWNLRDVLSSVRGEWLLLMEPGARPQFGWIDELSDYMGLSRDPARFSSSRHYRRPLLKRLGRRSPPLETGMVVSRQQALTLVQPGMALGELAARLKGRQLSCEMIPAWAARSSR